MKREGTSFILTDDEITDLLLHHINDADADEMSYIIGEVFGGICFPEEDESLGLVYKFEPTLDYCDAFKELE